MYLASLATWNQVFENTPTLLTVLVQEILPSAASGKRRRQVTGAADPSATSAAK